jgi:hypothetical protein
MMCDSVTFVSLWKHLPVFKFTYIRFYLASEEFLAFTADKASTRKQVLRLLFKRLGSGRVFIYYFLTHVFTL